MDALVAIINSLAWPVTVLIIIFMLRKHLRLVLPYVEKVKFKDFEVNFRKGLEDAKADAEEGGVKLKASKEEKEEILRLVEISPSSAVIESWKEIEIAARNKVTQLVKEEEKLTKAKRRPLSHLELTGALIPSTARAIRDLQSLRNQAAHAENVQISKENALEYVGLAKAIANQIDAITELPRQKLRVLTLLVLEFNHLVDTGKYNHISIANVHEAIEHKRIIEYIGTETAGDSDFSMFSQNGPYAEYLDYYHEQMYQLYGGYAGNERRKWGVENSGLCLLVAWTNELIQQGSGWHPYE
jgi:hypothetical protein